jgi:hypothetical protein
MSLVDDDVLMESDACERSEAFIARIEPYPDTFEDRGIVMCAGGVRYFTNAWIAISLLRHVGCTLPVQLWYLGPQELDAFMEELLQPLQVQCVDGTALRTRHPARILNGWELKPFSILHCPFREVLLLDADNFVTADPEPLFDSWEYRQTGAIFWPDRGRMQAASPIWELFGVPFLDEPEFETGQIVVNKERCWRALRLTKFYNDYSDFYYRYVYGDKETFHLAFRKTRQPYALTRHPMRHDNGVFYQHDFAGNVVFQHRNGAKWEFAGDNPPIADFRFDGECRRFLEQLRSAWDGAIGVERSSTSRDLGAAREALTANVYRYERPGYGYWPMSFLGDGRIGIGATSQEQTWRLARAHGRVQLEIGTDATPACVLQPSGSGWTGDADIALAVIPRADTAATGARLSLNEFIERVLTYAEPLSQNTAPRNLGFGWLYYGLARNLRPDFAIVIGSARGFAPLCIARALQDNGHGEVLFIDPGYSGSGDPGWDGRGHWQHASEVTKWFDLFGLAGWIRHLKLRSDEAYAPVRARVAGHGTGLALIDGAHTYENSLQDFELVASLMTDGAVLFHDATNPHCGVSRTLQTLRTRGHDVSILDLDVGLALVPIRRPPRVDQTWGYLVSASDRGALLMQHLRPLLRPGDRVFEAYCGFSPLNAHYEDVQVFGFDLDPQIIERLRAEYPQHRWEQIDERFLALAELPDQAEVLVGLGLSRGYCAWDAQWVEPNLRFLVRHYRPRVCLFEAAADYYNAEVLDDATALLERNGYACRSAVIETSMNSYQRRRLLLATAAAQ